MQNRTPCAANLYPSVHISEMGGFCPLTFYGDAAHDSC